MENGSFSSDKTLDNNVLKNELTAYEMANGSVDALEKAIFNCVRASKKSDIKKSDNPLTKVSFTRKEAFLSNTYVILENYWQLLTLMDYKYEKITEDGVEYHLVEQPESEYEVISILNAQRKDRLAGHLSSMSYRDDSLRHVIGRYKYIKNSKAFSIEICATNTKVLYYYISLITQVIFLVNYLPMELINERQGTNEFSVDDILKVFQQLSLLAVQYSDNYTDESIGAEEAEKLLRFCPVLHKRKLTTSLAKLTGNSHSKTEKILDFLEYKGADNDDLWCNPIYSISKNEYILLTSAIDSPNLLRTVEHWLVKLNIPIDIKGIHYENNIIDGLSNVLHDNEDIEDFERAICQRIIIDKEEEEIDLLCRIGNKILLGESKCIFTSDSPRSEYNTRSRLKEASGQVLRKKSFVTRNLKEIFNKLDWVFKEDEEYEIIGFIINSNKSFIGLSIDGISIIDENILFNYFKSSTFPILSTENNEEMLHLAWFELYNNFQEMLQNFSIYLKNPPPIIINKNSFKRVWDKNILISEKSNRFLLSKIVPIESDAKDIIKKDFPFKVCAIENIDEYDFSRAFFM